MGTWVDFPEPVSEESTSVSCVDRAEIMADR
jgi:hypothetical protein